MPKADPLGGFVAITGDMAKLMRDAEGEVESASRPPREAREIVLVLCDNPTLRQQAGQGIEEKLHEPGRRRAGQPPGGARAGAAEGPTPAIYRPYQKAIADLEEINYAGPAAAVPVGPAALPAPGTRPKGGNGEPELPLRAPRYPPEGRVIGGAGVQNIRERLASLKSLFEEGLITEEDFNTRKAAILAEV